MRITGVIPQLRTTDLGESIRFYTGKLGFALEFQQGLYPSCRLPVAGLAACN